MRFQYSEACAVILFLKSTKTHTQNDTFILILFCNNLTRKACPFHSAETLTKCIPYVDLNDNVGV